MFRNICPIRTAPDRRNRGLGWGCTELPPPGAGEWPTPLPDPRPRRISPRAQVGRSPPFLTLLSALHGGSAEQLPAVAGGGGGCAPRLVAGTRCGCGPNRPTARVNAREKTVRRTAPLTAGTSVRSTAPPGDGVAAAAAASASPPRLVLTPMPTMNQNHRYYRDICREIWCFCDSSTAQCSEKKYSYIGDPDALG
ncbi:uncharacterized protein [Hemitrygon akajei]|uniref:uncharacterized protein isoform X2 n=1 Tax=Hemitrygon akajei TaxID=2704970 RepID=UPI003BFA075D